MEQLRVGDDVFFFRFSAFLPVKKKNDFLSKGEHSPAGNRWNGWEEQESSAKNCTGLCRFFAFSAGERGAAGVGGGGGVSTPVEDRCSSSPLTAIQWEKTRTKKAEEID